MSGYWETEQEINQGTEHFQHCRKLSHNISQSLFSHPKISIIPTSLPIDYFTILDLYVIGVIKMYSCCLTYFTYYYVCGIHPDFPLVHPFPPLFKKISNIWRHWKSCTVSNTYLTPRFNIAVTLLQNLSIHQSNFWCISNYMDDISALHPSPFQYACLSLCILLISEKFCRWPC